MAKKQFKAESKRLMDLMINAIYTNKEIFLRELISNASDAIDKLYFRSLTDDSVKLSADDFAIRLTADKEKGTLTVSDNGCGMSKDELETNLGVIAKSGTLDFKNNNDVKEKDIDVIGQFGVGFYSAFMVADKITVISKAFGSDEAYKWESEGVDGYTVDTAEKTSAGTDIILHIRPDTDEEKYSRFLEEWTIKSLIKKYSDYISHPIKMVCEKTKYDDKGEKSETYTEDETLNSMIPVWKKSKENTTDEELNSFYRDKFFDYEAPAHVIRSHTEGLVSYDALLFIPSRTPFDFYSKDYKKGLMLYSNGVMIVEKCEELLPDCFAFVKGVVDSSDLSLNISREMLQKDGQLKAVAAGLKKKIRNELADILKDDREKYEKIFKNFGLSLKYGVYESFGADKELLSDLLLFESANENKLVTLKEYTDAMPAEQKFIYYACGDTAAHIRNLPQTELVRSKGFDILCLTDNVDEFCVKMLQKYADKEFKSVSDKDLGLDEVKNEELEQKQKESASLLDKMKAALDGKVSKVILSDRLVSHAVCLTSEGDVSLEMEKVLSKMPGSENGPKAERVLEINPKHDIFKSLEAAAEDEEKIKLLSEVLYGEALLIEGMPIDDPVDFSEKITKLIIG